MAGFGDVLRGLGSVLSPQVNQDVEGEYQKRQAQQQAMQQFALGQLVKGVESGAIAPDRLPEGLRGMVGVSPEAQSRMDAMKQEKAYREALAGLGPDASEDQIAQTAVKFGKPELALSYTKAKEERAARAQQAADALELRRAQLEQTRELALTRAADQKERDAINNQFKQQGLTLQAQIAASNAELRRLGINMQQQATQARIDAQANKPMTEFQGKAAIYGTRAAQSDKVLKALEDTVSLPGLAAGQSTGMLGNMMMSSEQKRISQAQRDFVNAVLRQESGAVISDQEFENAKKQYFPMTGDDKPTLDQKRANRQLAIQGFARMAGPQGSQEIKAIIDNPMLPGVSPNAVTPQQNASDAPPPGAVRRKK